MLFIARRKKLLSMALGSFSQVNRSITQTIARDNETLGLVIFYYGLRTLKNFFVYRVLTDFGKGYLGIYLNLDRRCAV